MLIHFSNSRLPLALILATLAFAWPDLAAAQIKQPGAHPTYPAELEPHLIFQHSRGWRTQGEGIGVGARVSIPLMQNGPLPKINNSLALGFGMDVAFYSDCQRYLGAECDARILWIPVVGQWNFFFTDVVSVFGEAGLGIRHFSASIEDNSYSHLDLFEPMFFGGGRFLFSDSIGLVVRLGTPYLSLGATFLL